MSIKDDFNEAIELWENATLLSKLILSISLFLTFSSVTSLSDSIFEWKGFIRDGVEFYRFWLVSPLANIARKLAINWSPSDIDFLVIQGMLIVSMMRVTLYGFQIGYLKQLKVWVVLGSVLVIASFIGISVFLGVKEKGNLWIPSCGMVFVYFAMFLLLNGRERVVFGYPVLLVVVIVLMLGAINAGLNHGAPL